LEAGSTAFFANSYLLIFAQTKNPLINVNCDVEHAVNIGGDVQVGYSSQLEFIAEFKNSKLVTAVSLQDEPTEAKPCSITTRSNVNPSAVAGEIIFASYQVAWQPANGDCYGEAPVLGQVDRTLYTFNYDPAALANSGQLTRTTHENAVPTPTPSETSFFKPLTQLILSGPNVHILVPQILDFNLFILDYRIARATLVNGSLSFGEYEQWPKLSVNGTTRFGFYTNFSAIPDYVENSPDSVLLGRQDVDRGFTASRVNLATGNTVSYQQVTASQTDVSRVHFDALIVGKPTATNSASGELYFYGVTSRSTVLVGQWQTSGDFEPEIFDQDINQGALNSGIFDPIIDPLDSVGSGAGSFAGPIVSPMNAPAAAGSRVVLSGQRLETVTKLEINGLNVAFTLLADGRLEVTLPAALADGSYDLRVTSSSGVVIAQGAVLIRGRAVEGVAGSVGAARGWMRNLGDGTVKMYARDLLGAGKVQLYHNGVEVAWVRAIDETDPKLNVGSDGSRDGIVRTRTLVPGKNVFEIWVAGERVRRAAYTG